MSNKGYAVLLVLAGIIFGILLVSLASSPAAAKLPDDGPVVAKPVTKKATPVPPTRPVPQDIRVYPVGTAANPNRMSSAHAYVVIDGKIWHCEGTTARQVRFIQ